MTRNTLLSLSLLLASAAPAAAFAQTAYLEQSGIVGQGKLLTISRLPTAQANGKIAYYDGTINLVVSAAGVPSVASSSFLPSAKLVTDHFLPGRYYIKDGSAAVQFGTLSEGVGSGGSTVWSLVMDDGPDGGFPDQAGWQTGAPAPDVAARLIAAKVPKNPDYSYGIASVGAGYCNRPFCQSNGLIAAEQVNQDLMLISYTDVGGTDQPGQQGSVILVRCVDAKCSNAPQ